MTVNRMYAEVLPSPVTRHHALTFSHSNANRWPVAAAAEKSREVFPTTWRAARAHSAPVPQHPYAPRLPAESLPGRPGWRHVPPGRRRRVLPPTDLARGTCVRLTPGGSRGRRIKRPDSRLPQPPRRAEHRVFPPEVAEVGAVPPGRTAGASRSVDPPSPPLQHHTPRCRALPTPPAPAPG